MAHSETKFNIGWLKQKDAKGHCQDGGVMHMKLISSKQCENYVTRKSKLQTMVTMLLCNMQGKKQ